MPSLTDELPPAGGAETSEWFSAEEAAERFAEALRAVCRQPAADDRAQAVRKAIAEINKPR
jgi:hypothetical protein